MSTNFYWRLPEQAHLPTGEKLPIDWDDPIIHIGKRSAAGLWCWDCDMTLYRGDVTNIHHSADSGWYTECPQCGKSKEDETQSGSIWVELGFADARTIRPTGVRSCASFSWAQDPWKTVAICKSHPNEELIEDEYHRSYSGTLFLEMLAANCPIEFKDTIGKSFS